ncbi:E3 SUMO-protein ligase [Phanerochaete sordida]|uniref:E3 SUMO-protein ligase n=1 Tax=Phanerochaete sordida TaxID=48140 RepID=A0A9P3G4G4_9APHY|nr:E3 SUMO-protein ligase [Phanerochaete sordida]
MSSTDVWAEFDTVRHNVKHNTVDRLKQIILSFNEQCGTSFTKSGKKQELIDRITRELDLWRRANNVDRWMKAKTILTQQGRSMYTNYVPQANSYGIPPPTTYSTPASAHFQSRPPGTSALPAYDPYAAPRRPAAPATTPAASSSSAAPTIQFKHSPFFRIDRIVSSIVECPESSSQMDRRQQSVSFYLTQEVIQKLESKSPKYQLRLYCTSSTYHSPTPSFRPNAGPCPIEFPPTCEVRVNNTILNANLKGMKKKPGTAPPPDLGKLLKLNSGAPNRVEIIYVNSQTPVPAKKYYLCAALVEVTTVDQLIDRLRKGKYRSSNEIVAKMAQQASEDDDIVAGSQKMSLKCPLSYMRIATPARSAHCVHSQCFDAYSWYSMMEQTTTWLCPVCEKVLNTEDLIVDGYFDDILKETHEDVEDVIVEADGQWHTADNKYGSASWKAIHPPIKDSTHSLPPTPVKKRTPSPPIGLTNGDAPLKSGPSNAEIVILDSDDEDEASIGSLPPRSQTVESDIIDLTLDSDDEDTVVSLPVQKKRKSDDRELVSPTEQIWKKSRLDVSPTDSTAVAHSSTPVRYSNSSSYSPPSRDPIGMLQPPSPPIRYNANGYAAHTTATAYASSTYIPPGGAPVPLRAPPYVPPPYHGQAPHGAPPPPPSSWSRH